LELLKTPPGIAEWPTHLDASQPGAGSYVVTLRLTPQEAAPFIMSIEAATKTAVATAELNPIYANKKVVPRTSWGQWNGAMWMQCRAQEPPLMFDSHGHRIKEVVRVTLGTRLSIAYTLSPQASVGSVLFGTDPKYMTNREDGTVQVGVTLCLVAVQLLPPLPSEAPNDVEMRPLLPRPRILHLQGHSD
jgi:hypothetical protein